jgi:hypothetical protein
MTTDNCPKVICHKCKAEIEHDQPVVCMDCLELLQEQVEAVIDELKMIKGEDDES